MDWEEMENAEPRLFCHWCDEEILDSDDKAFEFDGYVIHTRCICEFMKANYHYSIQSIKHGMRY